jgi:hypothetical protein
VYVEYLDGTQKLGTTFLNANTTIQVENNGNLNTIANPWTSYCSLMGCTAVLIRLNYDPNANPLVFQQGIPQISFHIRGNNQVYDPRLGNQFLSDGSVNPAAHAYTENPILIICDLLTASEETYGFGYSYATDIPLDMIVAQANICDTQCALAEGGFENQWTCNGQFDTSMSRGTILKNLLTSCAGRITEVGGQIFINAANWDDNYVIPSIDLFGMSAGGPEWRPTCTPDQHINGVKGTYVSPYANWQTADFPPYCQDAIHGYDPANLLPTFGGDINLAADNGERRWGNIQLPFCISSRQAQVSGKVELLRKRFYGTGTFKLNMAGYQFIPFDMVNVAFPFFGWDGTNKIVEVTNTRLTYKMSSLKNGDKVGLLGTEIDICETDSSIYQWSEEEELTPQGITQGNWFTQNYNEVGPFPWSPGYANPLPGDAIGGAATFGLQTVFSQDAAGNPSTTIQVKGWRPYAPDLELQAPELHCTAASGGTLRAGWYAVALSSYTNGESTHGYTKFLDIIPVQITADGGSINVEALWGSGDDGGGLYLAYLGTANPSLVVPAGGTYGGNGSGGSGGAPVLKSLAVTNTNAIVSNVAYTWHFQNTLEPGGETGFTNGVISSFNESTPGGPDVQFDHFEIVWGEIIHAGSWADTVEALTANSITVGALGMTSNQWAGGTLSLYARARFQPGVGAPVTTNPELLVLNMPIESSTASSSGLFTMTVGKNKAGVQLPDLTTLVNVNDVVVMRMNPIFTANSFSDKNVANGYYPNGATNVEVGHIAVVMTGADYGDAVPIANVETDSNGHKTIFNLEHDWEVQPLPGDIVVIVAPSTRPEWNSPKLTVVNAVAGVCTISEPQLENLPYQQYLLTARTVSPSGKFVPDAFAPMRDLYISGSQGTRTITVSSKLAVTDGTILADATAGDIVITLLPALSTPNQSLTIQKIDSTANTVLIQTTLGPGSTQVDLINGAASLNLTTRWQTVTIKTGGV